MALSANRASEPEVSITSGAKMSHSCRQHTPDGHAEVGRIALCGSHTGMGGCP